MLQGLALTILLGVTFTCAAGLRVPPCRLRLRRGHLSLHLLHGDRLPRLPRHHRHDLPDASAGSAPGRPLHADHHFGFEAAAWYWHFVDVVWLFLFVCIYVGGGGSRRRYARALSMPGGWRTRPRARSYPRFSPFATGLACRCPRCGRGRLFTGLPQRAPSAARPAASTLRKADSGDGPAVFLIFILGAFVVSLALWVEVAFEPPLWVTWRSGRAVILIAAHRPAAAAEGDHGRAAIPAIARRGRRQAREAPAAGPRHRATGIRARNSGFERHELPFTTHRALPRSARFRHHRCRRFLR